MQRRVARATGQCWRMDCPADARDGQRTRTPVVRLWPRRRSRRQKPADKRSEPDTPLQQERVDVTYLTFEELGDTTASLTLKDIIRAKSELAGKGNS